MKVYIKPLLILIPILLIGFGYFAYQNQKSVNTDSQSSTSNIETLGVESFIDWKDNKVQLSSFTDSNVVMHFWASWCAPCVEEFPQLIEMVQKQKGKTIVLAIAEDKDIGEVEVFVKSFPQALTTENFYILWDKDRSFMKRWNVDRLPESFIYSPDRKLAKKVSGAVNWTTSDAIEFFDSINKSEKAK